MEHTELCFSVPPADLTGWLQLAGVVVVGAIYAVTWVTRDARDDRFGSKALKLLQALMHGPKRGVPVLDAVLPTLLTVGLNRAVPWVLRRLAGGVQKAGEPFPVKKLLRANSQDVEGYPGHGGGNHESGVES